jgi:hypothetical protein
VHVEQEQEAMMRSNTKIITAIFAGAIAPLALAATVPVTVFNYNARGNLVSKCTPVSCPSNACGTVPNGCGGTMACGWPFGNICSSGTCIPNHK